MATASPAELQQLLQNLNEAASKYDGSPGPLDAGTRAVVREQARKVFLSMMSPTEMGIYHLLNFMEIIATRVCMEIGVFANMPEDRAIALEDLATACNMAPAFLQRILRILTMIQFVEQTDSEVVEYKHTKFSLAYRDPTSASSGALFKACYYIFLTNHLRFHEYITQELPKPYPEPDNIFNNSINWHLGVKDQPWFAPVAQNREIMQAFQIGLTVFDSDIPAAGPFYDFSQLVDQNDPNRIQIVDVGGGAGHVITKILAANPQLDPTKVVLQDIGRVLELATAAKDLGVQIMPHDFHKEQPVKGARAYYLRYILHDYNDAQATNILSQLAAAMSPDSVVLIAESVMPERVTESSMIVGVLDQVMLSIGGKERTQAEYEVALDNAGLRLERVCWVEGRNGAVIEAKLKNV